MGYSTTPDFTYFMSAVMFMCPPARSQVRMCVSQEPVTSVSPSDAIDHTQPWKPCHDGEPVTRDVLMGTSDATIMKETSDATIMTEPVMYAIMMRTSDACNHNGNQYA